MMAMSRSGRYVALVSLGLGLAVLCRAAVPTRKHHRDPKPRPPAAVVDYTRDVKPIFAARCCGCHGPTRHKAGLRLDTVAGLRKGGDSGAVIVPGDSANSLLIAVVTGAEDVARMPPRGEPLDARAIAVLRAWIDSGAAVPYDDELPESSGSEHWAFQPSARPAVPVSHDPALPCNPIDAFLAAEREKHGLSPSPPAARGLLLRRVSLDLVGLPPTLEELHAFASDASDDAYEKVVDRLLASPQYGERWGRHWMDVWRYSDADGRKAKKDIWWGSAHIWRWRDWIVKSLNADRGYDRMVIEMLAGDEATPGDPDALAATGFLVRNWFKLSRNIWLNNTVEHTGKAFLGITINCARCHDHKFDPITQKEYFQFRAFFQAHDIRTELPPGDDECSCRAMAYAYDAHPKEPTWIFVRGDERTPDKATPIEPAVPSALGGPRLRVEPIPGPDAKHPASTGRRLALAQWICDRQNPLAARVAVNHMWARHFGRPLVDNVADFGQRTAPPVQKPLLDWLAVEFMEHGWSMKWLHRLIVTSATYRMQASPVGATAENLAADPDNKFYWRMNARRMEAEAVRDSLLWLGGVLDLTAGGPPLDHARGTDSGRRSLYYRYSREDKMDFLTAFDAPGVEECYRRQESIIPQQALALENSEFAWLQARRIARRLESVARDRHAFVTAAFEQILGRSPEPAEKETCESFLVRQERLLSDSKALSPFPPPPPPAPIDPEVARKVPGLPLVLGTARSLPPVAPADDPAGRAREYLVHALLNHNDFITVR
jgi:mono/diheme cytochrome c family protein